MPSSLRWFAYATLVVLLDQASKLLVLSVFVPGERRLVTEFFNLVLVFNKGAAFSMLSQASGWQTPLLVAFALVAAVVVGVLLVRMPERKLLCSGLALILGGAVGNVIDRLLYGQVVDFLDFHAYGWHWPAFNVADSSITVGAVVVILESFVHHERRPGAAS